MGISKDLLRTRGKTGPVGEDSSMPPSGGTSWPDIMDRDAEQNENQAKGPVRRSWASVLGTSLPPRDDRNVLEVVLEKDSRGSFTVSESECAHMMKKLGLDERPGVHVEAVQICPQGRGVIYITLKKEIDITRFCRYDVLEVSASGIRAVLVKPAVKKEVIVSAKGIHPNTRDSVVLDYLARFGKLSTNKVVYGVYSEGPLKGLRNGNRSYKLEIRPGVNLGSYHYIDSQKVTFKYPGQQQTCARCFKTSQSCRGKGVARRCEVEGGEKVEFPDYILDLWSRIGYSPGSLEIECIQGLEESDPYLAQQSVEGFTPMKIPTQDTDKFTGVSLKQFPPQMDHGEIVEFLVKCGVPESKKENININSNGKAIIKDLTNNDCLTLIDAIHGKKYFGQKMFCNGFIPLTPEKADSEKNKNKDNNDAKSPSLPEITTAGVSANTPPSPAQASSPAPTSAPSTSGPASSHPTAMLLKSFPPVQITVDQQDAEYTPLGIGKEEFNCHSPNSAQKGIGCTTLGSGEDEVDCHSPNSAQRDAEYTPQGTGKDQLDCHSSNSHEILENPDFPSNSALVRRHSLSLMDRTPPPNSIAADILGSNLSFQAAKALWTKIAEVQDSLSDFKSCVSSGSSSDESADDLKKVENVKYVTANERKREKRKKRKLTQTPDKDQFLLKKANLQASPQ